MIQLEGYDDFIRKLNQGDKAVRLAAAQAVHDAVREVENKSMSLVPFDTGALHDSRVVKLPNPSGTGRIQGSVAYGGTAAPYAVVQHENLEYSHPAKDKGGTGPVAAGRGRGAKYLEFPLKQVQRTFAATIVKRINQKLARMK